MDSSKSFSDYIDEFQKLSSDLADAGEQLSKNTLAILLLNLLLDKYDSLRDTPKYGKDTSLILDLVIGALKMKHIELNTKHKRQRQW